MATAPRLDRLRIRQLRLLDLVARYGSLTAAAEHLGVSQPSATKLLQEMEQVLRCTLVDRNTRGGVLTDSGRRALERVRPAINALDLIPQAVLVEPQHPVVRMGILRLAGISILPELVWRLRSEQQLPRLQLQEGVVPMLMEQLHEGLIDCIIGRLEPSQHVDGHSRLDITQLNNDPYGLTCASSHPLCRRRAVALHEVLHLPWVLTPRSTYTRQVVDMAFMSQGIPAPTPLIESLSFHASFAVLARNPEFITIAPCSSIRYYERLGMIRPIKLKTPFPSDRMVFVTKKDLLGISAIQHIKRQLVEMLVASP